MTLETDMEVGPSRHLYTRREAADPRAGGFLYVKEHPTARVGRVSDDVGEPANELQAN